MDDITVDSRPQKRVKLDSAPVDGSADGNLSSTDLPLGESASFVAIANEFTIDDNAKELEVGITIFVDECRSVVKGIFKKRYTDFLVNEILPDGTVVHLRRMAAKGTTARELQTCVVESAAGKEQEREPAVTETETPVIESGLSEGPRTDGPDMTTDGMQKSEAAAPSSEISESDHAKLLENFSEQTVDQMISLYNSVLQRPAWKPREHPMVRTPFTSDRNHRSQIHQDIRRIFQSKIDSSTDKDGILVLTAGASNRNNRGGRAWTKPTSEKGQRPGKLDWLDRGGEYLHFSLYKENKDTLEVISFLTKQLKTTSRTFQFAGTKDRRAVTVQRVSAYRIEAGRLAGLNRTLRYAAVGDFEYRKQGLELGDLSGNEFVVTLRDCALPGSPELHGPERLAALQSNLSCSLRQLREKGFLNYFGLQRFGTFTVRTDAVGLRILKGDFQAACDAILDFSPSALNPTEPSEPSTLVSHDDRARAKGISIFRKTGAINDALDQIPRKFTAETALIRHLSRRPQDYLGALLSIQRNLRLMYIHAYQSLVWNLAVGERWRLFGDQVVEGDLVLVHEQRGKEASEEEKQTVDADGEIVIEPSGDDRANDPEDMFERARPLSATEAASGAFSIFDVVLTLPGFDVLYPANAVGDWYKTFMASEAGGGLDPYNMRRKQKDFSLSGGYRKVMARIGHDWEVQVHEYEGGQEDKQFVQTDMERIETEKWNKDQCASGKVDEQSQSGIQTSGSQPVTKLAAVLKFQLGSSQYATMALRELSKGGIQAYKAEFVGGR